MNGAVELPPYAGVLGATLSWQDERPVLSMPFGDDVLGRPGFVQGGAISGLLEVAAIAALRHALAAEGGGRVKPINVTIDFMRGGREKTTHAAGVVTRLGTRIANVEATAWQDDPTRPIAAARMNYMISREPMPAA